MIRIKIKVGIHTAALTFGCLLAFNAQAQNTGPQSWCKSKYGPDDQFGAANLLTPELTLNAAKLVKSGKTYSLGTETNAKTPAFGPRVRHLIRLEARERFHAVLLRFVSE